MGTLPRSGGPSGAPDLIVEANDGEPAEQAIFRVRTSLGGGGPEARRISRTPGWHSAVTGGDVLVIDDEVWRGAARVATLSSAAATPPYRPRPILERVTDRRLPAAVLYPTAHVSGTKLPVLVTFGAGPHTQQVVTDPAAWQEKQWWADAGFAVVCIDGRGTPGLAPSFEKVVHRRLVDMALTDRVDGLRALVGKHPDLDLGTASGTASGTVSGTVCVRGDGLGGWLAAMAVLRRPDVFGRAVARQPLIDFGGLPRTLAERYLGDPAEVPDAYAHHSLAEAGSSPDVLLVGARLPGFPSKPVASPEEELAFLRRPAGSVVPVP